MNDLPSKASQFETLDPNERRVLGVLVEKAKTTPDAYPLSLNALRTGCNQKSNRLPQMSLDEEQVDRAADSLREKKAISLVQGDSRVERFRHLGYDWFSVDKVELAVIAELLMRGAQTVGELRARAARMEPIKGLSELSPVLENLVAKGYVKYLSPPGRGAVVSHTFYSEREMERVLRDLGLGSPTDSIRVTTEAPAQVSTELESSSNPSQGEIAELRKEIAQLRKEFEEFRSRVEG